MSKKVVLDASAVLAVFNKEKGRELILEYMEGSIISSVNSSEVYKSCFYDSDLREEEVNEMMEEIRVKVISFDDIHARIAAQLYATTKSCGLSLGDRACIALGMIKKIPVLTCDTIWQQCNLDVQIITAR
ncbi:type II toxin-antitoxin system VapC family toxin [Candidatus Sneabacter namystus]|uniref:Type II toxin-antitoxin system VapC family toxin n=1 Tax=Candidatus Sneabacter namystus TaxID=2601646 RepID=A0A5C0UGY6_9RICK|nr:type II toxin-antitoxin system VapC family toxin [Candidatus Sneabacter namystus]QEK39348.1 type II toxin-antitoxin system VapC family toxin [Candidatus Sneabacter namystus]